MNIQNTQDLQKLQHIRQQCLRAISMYNGMLHRFSEPRLRQILIRMTVHRIVFVSRGPHALSSSAEEPQAGGSGQLAQKEMESLPRREEEFSDMEESAQMLETFIEHEKREIQELRESLKRIDNPILRRRLSAFVATLQMDLDQLKALSTPH